MKRVLNLLLILLLVTGCSYDYELEIFSNNIKEKVNFVIKDDDIYKANLMNEAFSITDIYSDDETEQGRYVIDKLRNNEFNPMFSSEELYNKVRDGDKISLSYTYLDSDYKDSNLFNSCFGDAYFDNDDNYYLIWGYNQFKCLFEDSVDVVVKTDYKVIKSNADRVVGNKYIWTFDRNNNLDHEMYIQVSKKIKNTSNSYFRLIIGSVFLISLVIYVIYRIIKLFKKRSINDEI